MPRLSDLRRRIKVAQQQGGGGTEISLFRVTTGAGDNPQLTTGTYATLAGIWGTPILATADFTWSSADGSLTVNANGTIDIDAHITAYQSTGANRTELRCRVMHDGGGGASAIAYSMNYSQRNTTQRMGGVEIPGLIMSVSSGDVFTFQVMDVGTAVEVGHDLTGANSSWISARLHK
jgi:hypothetical protein